VNAIKSHSWKPLPLFSDPRTESCFNPWA